MLPTAFGSLRPLLRVNATTVLNAAAKSSRSPTCVSPRACASSHLARLESALSPSTSDAVLAEAVDDYLGLTPAEQQTCWAHMQERCSDVWPRQVHALAQRVAVASPRSLDWFASVRSLCAQPQVANTPWARQVDTVMASSVRPLYGASFLHLQQLRYPGTHEARGTGDTHATGDVGLHEPHAMSTVRQPLSPHVQAAVLAQVKAGETVHKTDNDAQFAVKFGLNRTVHALLHTADPRQLLAVLYTAHMKDIPASMADIDAQTGGDPGAAQCWDPAAGGTTAGAASTAAFYSVSSHAAVARGLRLGTAIIYRTAGYLAQVNPNLKKFVTLSPIPEFCSWLQQQVHKQAAQAAQLERVLSERGITMQALEDAARASGISQQSAGHTPQPALALLASILKDASWWRAGPAVRSVIITATAPLVRAYLLTSSTAMTGPQGGGAPVCRVAAFHLGNGARMLRICAGADPSAAGLARSAGFNVNYCYSLDGARGLAWTMKEGAAHYAAGPAVVLAQQSPEVTVADTVGRP